MASWLFAQYMLTNDVQIAYSSTEGYVPVTTKAQESSQYKDYLARAGEDADEHYDVKIAAAELLLGNMQNTFTTPVFNGSTALRNAAGQLIENVAKSTRRHETIDDDYMNKLYSDVESLYKLDQYGGASKDSQSQLGELPVASKLLDFVHRCKLDGNNRVFYRAVCEKEKARIDSIVKSTKYYNYFSAISTQ